VGWPSWGDALHALFLGLPGLAVYLLLLCYKRREQMFAMLCVLALVACLLLPVLPYMCRPTGRGLVCYINLKQVGLGLMCYENRIGSYPKVSGKAYLLALQQSGDLPNPRDFGCRVPRTRSSPCDYVPNPALAGQGTEAYAVADPAATPWVWEEQAVDHDRGFFSKPVLTRTVLFLDGHVACMNESDFQAMLARRSR
jgi:prepilin-type processing-associated H-X9-DG protein